MEQALLCTLHALATDQALPRQFLASWHRSRRPSSFPRQRRGHEVRVSQGQAELKRQRKDLPVFQKSHTHLSRFQVLFPCPWTYSPSLHSSRPTPYFVLGRMTARKKRMAPRTVLFLFLKRKAAGETGDRLIQFPSRRGQTTACVSRKKKKKGKQEKTKRK